MLLLDDDDGTTAASAPAVLCALTCKVRRDRETGDLSVVSATCVVLCDEVCTTERDLDLAAGDVLVTRAVLLLLTGD